MMEFDFNDNLEDMKMLLDIYGMLAKHFRNDEEKINHWMDKEKCGLKNQAPRILIKAHEFKCVYKYIRLYVYKEPYYIKRKRLIG